MPIFRICNTWNILRVYTVCGQHYFLIIGLPQTVNTKVKKRFVDKSTFSYCETVKEWACVWLSEGAFFPVFCFSWSLLSPILLTLSLPTSPPPTPCPPTPCPLCFFLSADLSLLSSWSKIFRAICTGLLTRFLRACTGRAWHCVEWISSYSQSLRHKWVCLTTDSTLLPPEVGMIWSVAVVLWSMEDVSCDTVNLSCFIGDLACWLCSCYQSIIDEVRTLLDTIILTESPEGLRGASWATVEVSFCVVVLSCSWGE